jgi:hypothetical protein
MGPNLTSNGTQREWKELTKADVIESQLRGAIDARHHHRLRHDHLCLDNPGCSGQEQQYEAVMYLNQRIAQLVAQRVTR